MNLFNRIVLIVVFLALAAGGVAVAVMAWTLPNESIERLAEAVQWLDDNNQELERAALAAAALFVAVVAIALLLLELMPRPISDVKVTDVKAGDAYLSTAAIGQRIEEAVGRVSHVSDVRAIVKARRKGVELSLDLHVEPQANLATVTDAAIETTRDVLTNQVHVALVAPPRVRLHYRELVLKRGAATRPAQTPPALEAGTPDEEPKLLSEAVEEERREAAAEGERELVAAAPAASSSEADGRESASPESSTRRENE
jgi:hypothetical protein